MKFLSPFIVLGTLSIAATTLAKPPQMAIDACKGVSSGGACHFHARHGEVSGSCQQPPREQQLVCVPSGKYRGGDDSDNHKRRDMGLSAQSGQRTRKHSVVQSDGNIETLKATASPILKNTFSMVVVGDQRILRGNGIAEHLTGHFPNGGNPHQIKTQSYKFSVPAKPKLASKITPLGMHNFGLSVNGVPFDPAAAEWYLGDRNSGWQYEALSGAITLGLDENHAHVQPSGAYHYHGVPTLLVSDLKLMNNQHSPLVGWAADGFPIYALYGYQNADNNNSKIIKKSSSYQLKKGARPSGGKNPGGYYDGTFIADYKYVAGSGNLDECNGQYTQTPEFPKGTYAYFLTESFPVIPRCYKGAPSKSFTQQRAR